MPAVHHSEKFSPNLIISSNNSIKLISDIKRHFVMGEICGLCEREDWKSIRIIHGEVPLREINKNWRRYRRELKILIWITMFYLIWFQQLPYRIKSGISESTTLNNHIDADNTQISEAAYRKESDELYNPTNASRLPKSSFPIRDKKSSYTESEKYIQDGLFLFQLMLKFV
jgi:hypothetical protein